SRSSHVTLNNTHHYALSILEIRGGLLNLTYHRTFTCIQIRVSVSHYEAYVSLNAGNRKDAVHHILKILECNSTNLKNRRTVALFLRNCGEYYIALKILLETIEINPNWAFPYAQIAILYSAMGDTEKANIWTRKALSLNVRAFNEIGYL
ncbi:MAG: hypothetical protein IJU79_07105, partial [Desulfovibrionaceae bacterium]|nr:hypothetical protein [Desulfovibrionaceae bacterium]